MFSLEYYLMSMIGTSLGCGGMCSCDPRGATLCVLYVEDYSTAAYIGTPLGGDWTCIAC